MQSAPKQPIDLTGRWSLDRRESDDVRARLQPLIEKREQRFRRIDRAIEEGPERGLPPDNLPSKDDEPEARREGPRDVPSELSTRQWLRQERQRETLVLIALLGPPTKLELRQSGREMRIVSDKGEGTRVLMAGETSALFVAAGGFEVSSGWSGTSFLVSSLGTGENSIRLIERYTLLDGGNRLEEVVEAQLPSLGKQSFRYVFNRTPNP